MPEDQKNRRLGVLWGFICLINLLAILFLTGTTTLTAVRICRAGEARAFLDTLHNVERVEVLPYHTMGLFKWEKLGIPYPLPGITPPAKERVANAEEILGCK